MAEVHRLAGNPESRAELQADVERLARTSVLVLGDATLERRVLGRFDDGDPGGSPGGGAEPSMPGPAPDRVPEFRLGTEEAEPGGGGGIVRALAGFGIATAFVCVLGDDLAGAELTALIGAQSNVEPWLLVDAVKATTTETRYVARARDDVSPADLSRADAVVAPEQIVLRTIREDGRPINAKLRARMLRIAGDAMAATSMTVLCDRGHGTLDTETATEILARSRQAGRRVVADLERVRGTEHRFRGYDAVVGLAPDEAARAPEAAELAATMRREAEIGAAVLFLPGGGALLADREGIECVPFASPAAGYARFVAAFAGAMALGRSLRHAARVAGFAQDLPTT